MTVGIATVQCTSNPTKISQKRIASSAPPYAMPSLRNMRDTYVNLLLSNGQQPIEPPPQTPRPSWTPGQGLGTSYKERAVHWASPVTPALTENEMRVAEVAANLVAAGDAEKRNKDTIRALSDRLEATERRNHELEVAARTEEKKRKQKRRISYGDARRNIHFTPRTPRRSGGLDLGSEKRRSRKVEREWSHESPFHLELESLRMEQAQWRQEREKFRSMMSDIKRNTSRLLDEREKLRRYRDASAQERDSHLQLIAHLQTQLLEKKQAEDLEKKKPLGPSPRCADGAVHFASPTTVRHRDFSDVPVFRHHDVPNEEDNGPPTQAHNLGTSSSRELTAASLEEEMSAVQDEFGREEELRTELHLVNQENIRVSERNAALETETIQLQERIRLLETENSTLRGKLKHREHDIEAGAGKSSAPIGSTQLANLLEEINILESVSVAIHFEMSPSEADRVQETLGYELLSKDSYAFTSDVNDISAPVKGSSGDDAMNSPIEHKKYEGLSSRKYDESRYPATKSLADTIKYAVQRLAAIRTDLCSKYGKWLEAVANDVSSAGGETELESMDKENMILFDVASDCMNTNVINELVES